MGLRVTLQGIDITAHVQEETIQIQDVLGQDAGNGSGTSGRAKTCTIYCDLGPVGTAVGAGTVISQPQLVRLGEIKIYDASNTQIFGGFITKMVDHLGPGAMGNTRYYTELDCSDYWQFLDRIMVDVVYDGNTDIFMINDLLATYASWIDRSLLPTAAAYTFGPKLYRHISLKAALQNICDTTGYMMWILPNKKIQYVLPTNAANAPFSLSDTPDGITTFRHNVTDFEIDDNAAINNVIFYGGKKLSSDYLQNLSNQANGTNTIFLLPFYPHPASDGHVHVYKNNVELALGTATGSDTNGNNVLKSKGGNADVLLNTSGSALTFDVPPASTDLVQCKYRYEFPLVVSLSEQASISFYGQILQGVIIDTSVLDSTTAAQRCRILLLEQSFGLTTLQVTCWQPGLQAGMLLSITNTKRGINSVYVLQEVDYVPLGAGNFEYDLTLGAWNWNLVDILMLFAQAQTPQDTNADESLEDVIIQTVTESVGAHDTMAITKTQTFGQYYARAAAVGDGHDAYPGFASISS